MIRALTGAVLLGLTTMPLSSDSHCGNAYAAFLEHIGRRTATISTERLVTVHRNGLRIFDACVTGHLENAEQRFRDLERI